MYLKIINFFSEFFEKIISSNLLEKLQETLIMIDLYVKVTDLIAIIFLFSVLMTVSSIILFNFLNIDLRFSILFLFSIPLLTYFYVLYKKNKRIEKIEADLPDYLLQISSLLKVGMGIETALNEISKTSTGPLNNEIKRVLIEISLGKSFNNALIEMSNRVKYKPLENTLEIIIRSRESGGNLADILESIAEDLTDTIMLKKNRKASVMMSVMFLLISSVIATPFAFGMIQLYSEFIQSIGRYNILIEVIPLISVGYILINSVLVSVLLGIILYSNEKRGIPYIFIIAPISLLFYFFSQLIIRGILGI